MSPFSNGYAKGSAHWRTKPDPHPHRRAQAPAGIAATVVRPAPTARCAHARPIPTECVAPRARSVDGALGETPNHYR